MGFVINFGSEHRGIIPDDRGMPDYIPTNLFFGSKQLQFIQEDKMNKIISLSIPEEMLNDLKSDAKKELKNVSEFIRMLYMEWENKPIKRTRDYPDSWY